MWMEVEMQRRLQERQKRGTLRRLSTAAADRVDFSSNDYLGLARDIEQYRCVQAAIRQQEEEVHSQRLLGATGSRLLSGDAPLLHQVEAALCTYHQAQSALLCNSGYDANLALVSTFAGTCLLYDSYIHNSLHMGLRWWQQSRNDSDTFTDAPRKTSAAFAHNQLSDLQRLLQEYTDRAEQHKIGILIESIYSMDGDMAPVRDILDLARRYHAVVLVDEAHGFGVHGTTGVLAEAQCQRHPALAAAVYTFGKAAGCHGAVICAPHSATLKEYLINYGNPIIYSTALPLHSILAIHCAYETITGPKGTRLRQQLQQHIAYFRRRLTKVLETLMTGPSQHPYYLLPSDSPIHALVVPGNAACVHFCQRMFEITTLRLLPIRAPTVPPGQERIRIVLHAHNTQKEMDDLIAGIQQTLQEMIASVAQSISQHSKL